MRLPNERMLPDEANQAAFSGIGCGCVVSRR